MLCKYKFLAHLTTKQFSVSWIQEDMFVHLFTSADLAEVTVQVCFIVRPE
jgi:hypothetical protein